MMAKDADRRVFYAVSLPSNMLRRFVQLLAFLVLVVFMQSHFTSIRESDFLKNTLGALGTFKQQQQQQQHVKCETLHVLLLAYARTGSSFAGDLIQSFPDAFYHFEPLHFIDGPVLNRSFNEARDLLANLFVCNISQIENFLPWQMKHQSFMKLQRNTLYWKECSKTGSCYNGTYINNFCLNKTTVIAKTIRLNLFEASKMFTSHPHLNLKIIYLTRDPRGTMNSRMKKPINLWCKKDIMCYNTSQFCSGINADVETACALSKERSEDFMVIRYEDVSLDPYRVAAQLSKFLGYITVPGQVQEFLKTHTYVEGNIKRNSKVAGLEYAYMTFRNSAITAMSWRKEMNFMRVRELQRKCGPFLSTFGYHSYRTLVSLKANNNMNGDLSRAIQFACF